MAANELDDTGWLEALRTAREVEMGGRRPRWSEVATFCNPTTVSSTTIADALATATNSHLDIRKHGAPRSMKGKGRSRLSQ
jgi:hypothetical protein